ncbi:hypothetical protein I552_1566 [Mycobacterium xenopi 3993]|nr:hypothetical protein I552_1566 [Mycobacterium xenopi 3993]
MPTRARGAFVGQGPRVNPIGDEVLAILSTDPHLELTKVGILAPGQWE